jgi:exopolysaccharide biosynthesis polyprenyl glycosylphosphotransferase
MSDVTQTQQLTEIDLTNDIPRKVVQDSAPVARNVRPVVRHRKGDSRRLRQRSVALDCVAAIFSWVVTHSIVTSSWTTTTQGWTLYIIQLLAFTVVAVGLMFVAQLYRTRISMVASTERARVALVAVVLGASSSVIYSTESKTFSIAFAVIAGITFFVSTVLLRSLFRQWLRIQRAHGRYHREILLVGTNTDALAMYELLRTHPEVGFTIIGVVGKKDESESFSDVAWCGESHDVVAAVRKTGATGVVISSNALSPQELRHVTNKLLHYGVHVHVSTGLFGFDERRLRPQSFSREPVFYVEPLSYPLAQRAVKRGADIIFASVGLVFAAPIIAIAAVFIKSNDRGPVFFHQTRVGKDGQSFRCIKLRTMSVGAEKNLNKVMENNERQGPLFKRADDPRRTPIGRILEATSLDELPQLWLVLRGTMSLIGPRPALPHEVALFDDELNHRHIVRPGITGLWQVEGRDNPSFDAYRRLDLFYVENWSLLLDFSIFIMTFQVVLSRAIKTIGSLVRPSWARAGVSSPGADGRE